MIVINAGKLIDGTGAQPRQNVRLLIDEGRILDIVDMASSVVPEGAQVLDASNRVIMPGMIDAHVHIGSNPDEKGNRGNSKERRVSELPGTLALKAYVHVNLDLQAGFTTVRDMGCRDFVGISLRDAINDGVVEGPRICACGYGLTSTGGHMDRAKGMRLDVSLGGFNNVVDSADEARKATRMLLRMGVDHIKINSGNTCRVRGRPLFMVPEMRKDVMQAICEEAHTARRRVASHSQGSEGELWAVEVGVDSLEHAHFISDETLRLMAERGTFLIPTMTHCVVNRKRNPKEIYDIAYESMHRVIPKALSMGVRVATGTDAGAGVPHGINALELELLTTVGMSPMEAIVAATGTAAEVLDMADSLGTLEKGQVADLLVVRGDPLQDISLLQDKQNIVIVMKSGNVVVSRED